MTGYTPEAEKQSREMLMDMVVRYAREQPTSARHISKTLKDLTANTYMNVFEKTDKPYDVDLRSVLMESLMLIMTLITHNVYMQNMYAQSDEATIEDYVQALSLSLELAHLEKEQEDSAE